MQKLNIFPFGVIICRLGVRLRRICGIILTKGIGKTEKEYEPLPVVTLLLTFIKLNLYGKTDWKESEIVEEGWEGEEEGVSQLSRR